MKRSNIIGNRFGALTVIAYSHTAPSGRSMWICVCDCGKEIVLRGYSLTTKNTKSCGCRLGTKKMRGENGVSVLGINETHGHTTNKVVSPEYRAWINMKTRCYNVNSPDYSNYGGRGIYVCDRWLNSFKNFLSDMGKRPTSKHSLDRFPNNATGVYEPSNCRWATAQEQSDNKRPRKKRQSLAFG